MNKLISINGTILDPETANISVLDRGFLFGDNVFEVFVSFGVKTLNISSHLKRLRQSAEQVLLPIPWSDEELAFEINALVERANNPKTYIRLIITRGAGTGLHVSADLSPNKFIYCLPAPIEKEEVYKAGLSLCTKKLPYTERKPSIKTGNYLRSITELITAQKRGFHDVLWVNSSQEITEATTSNIFFIGREGDFVEIATPALNSGLLAGITRQTIIQLLNESKIQATERIIEDYETPKFDEAFLCSTVRGLVPVSSIDNHRLHTTRDHSVFNHVKKLFMSWVTAQVGYKADWNTGQKK